MIRIVRKRNQALRSGDGSVGRLQAALFDFGMRLTARRMDPLRHRVASTAGGRVLEIGAGTGLNLPHYSPNASVFAIEPDPAMIRRARMKAGRSAANVHLVIASAEALPFRDSVFDEAVGTLVFCTIPSPTAAFAELKRVLRPPGRLHFHEYIRSSNPTWARVQDAVTPAWKCMVDGCCPNRPTLDTMEGAGFAIESVEHFTLGPWPTRPQAIGVAKSD